MNKSYERMIKREIDAGKIRSTPELISPLLTPIYTPLPKLSPTPSSSTPPIPSPPLIPSQSKLQLIGSHKSKIIIPEYINGNNLRKRDKKCIECNIIINDNIKNIKNKNIKNINKFVKTNYLTKMSFIGLVIAVNFMVNYIYYNKNNSYRLLIKN